MDQHNMVPSQNQTSNHDYSIFYIPKNKNKTKYITITFYVFKKNMKKWCDVCTMAMMRMTYDEHISCNRYKRFSRDDVTSYGTFTSAMTVTCITAYVLKKSYNDSYHSIILYHSTISFSKILVSLLSPFSRGCHALTPIPFTLFSLFLSHCPLFIVQFYCAVRCLLLSCVAFCSVLFCWIVSSASASLYSPSILKPVLLCILLLFLFLRILLAFPISSHLIVSSDSPSRPESMFPSPSPSHIIHLLLSHSSNVNPHWAHLTRVQYSLFLCSTLPCLVSSELCSHTLLFGFLLELRIPLVGFFLMFFLLLLLPFSLSFRFSCVVRRYIIKLLALSRLFVQ